MLEDMVIEGATSERDYMTLIVDGGGLITSAWAAARREETASERIRHGVDIALSNIAESVKLCNPGARVVVCWDGKDNRAYRRGYHPWYKHGRGSSIARDEVEMARKLAFDVCHAMGIDQVQIDGHEADDLVASIAADAEGQVLMLSDDKDYLQLVCDRVHLKRRSLDGVIIDPMLASSTDTVIGDVYLYQKSMMGDGGDNVKPLFGIGEAKALKLLSIDPDFVKNLRDDVYTPEDVLSILAQDAVLEKAFLKAGRDASFPGPIKSETMTDIIRLGLKLDADLVPSDRTSAVTLMSLINWAYSLVRMVPTIDYSSHVVYGKFDAASARIAMARTGVLNSPRVGGLLATMQQRHTTS